MLFEDYISNNSKLNDKDSKKIETNMDESHDIIKIEDNEREPLLMEI